MVLPTIIGVQSCSRTGSATGSFHIVLANMGTCSRTPPCPSRLERGLLFPVRDPRRLLLRGPEPPAPLLAARGYLPRAHSARVSKHALHCKSCIAKFCKRLARRGHTLHVHTLGVAKSGCARRTPPHNTPANDRNPASLQSLIGVTRPQPPARLAHTLAASWTRLLHDADCSARAARHAPMRMPGLAHAVDTSTPGHRVCECS